MKIDYTIKLTLSEEEKEHLTQTILDLINIQSETEVFMGVDCTAETINLRAERAENAIRDLVNSFNEDS